MKRAMAKRVKPIVPLSADITRNAYVGEKAANYDATRQFDEKWANEHAAVKKYLAGTTGRVLDIPVGTGRFLELYAKRGLEVVGLDTSEDMMGQARARDTAADIRYGDILNIEYPDRYFDATVCVRLLNLIDQDEMVRAVSELCRVTSGRLILSIRIAQGRGRKARTITHDGAVFFKAVSRNGFRRAREVIVGKDNYLVMLLVR